MQHIRSIAMYFTCFASQPLIVFLCMCVCVKAKQGYKNLTGIDYSPASVDLARSVLQAEDITDVILKVS